MREVKPIKWTRPAVECGVIAIADCPYCGRGMAIKKATHQVTASGKVTPWVMCLKAHDLNPPRFCPFRGLVSLKDWGKERQ